MRTAQVFIISTAIFFLYLSSAAQPLVKGEEALNNQDYYQAQEYFDQVIEQAAVVNPFELALAYYYRAWTWIKLYGKGPGDITSIVSDPSGDMLLNAYDDLLNSLTHEDGRLTERINDLLVQLEPGLMQYGLVMVNRAEDLNTAGKPYKATAEYAIDYLDATVKINSSYLAYDLLGQAYLMTEEKEKALDMLEKSTFLYSNNPPEIPDFKIGYAFFRIGMLYRGFVKDDDKCLDAVQAGEKLLTAEYRRMMNYTSGITDSQLEKLESDYNKTLNDLHTLKLETLLKSPTKLSEAQAVFKNEMQQHPEDVNLIIAYASLFEKTDPEVSVTYYKKALEMDPGNPTAKFNLGVAYFNQGQKFFDEGVRAEDEDKQDVNIDKAREYFKLARPVFEKVLESDPDDEEAISALQLICFALDDLKMYKYYTNRLEEIKE